MLFSRYERTYRGLGVVGGEGVVVTNKAGQVLDTTAGRYGRVSQHAHGALRSLKPTVAASAAATTARARLASVDSAGRPLLVVHALTSTPRLAWEVLVEGTRVEGGKTLPSRQKVWVDAVKGSVLGTQEFVADAIGNGFYNGQVTIGTSGSAGQYVLRDPSHGNIQCGNQTGQPYTKSTDTWGNGAGSNLEAACVDVMYAGSKEFDMLRDWLGRNGVTGGGGTPPARVGLAEVNAYWNGSYVNFGHNQANNQQATPIDVVAHEYGHAIDQYTGGAAAEAGLGEGTGDIFGALTEAYAANPNDPADFTVGEEVNLAGNGPIRYMYKPSTNGDPDCYSSRIPSTEVHSAAGPLNHWFYLVSQGSNSQPASPTCNNATVTGIGIQKAGKVFMGAMNRKTSGWSYARYRSSTLAAAVELYGANSAECTTVKAAWNAVSVPQQSGEPTCGTATDVDFALSVSPASGSVARGASATTTVATQKTGTGSAAQVTLTASGLPAGVTATFTPATVTAGGSSSLRLTASSGAALGSKAVTVTGSGGGKTHSASYTVTVTGTSQGTNDFAVALSPSSAGVAAGGTTRSTVQTSTTAGSTQPVTLSVSGAPAGVTATVSPTSVSSGQSASLSITVAASTAPGTYRLTITGSGTAGTKAATFTLTVTGGDGGPGCGSAAAWSATQAYGPGDRVAHNGRLWTSAWYSTGAEPGAPGSWSVWSDAGPC